MKALLAKAAIRKGIGVYITDQELTLSLVAQTPLGPVELERRSRPIATDQLAEELARELKPWIGRRKPFQAPVAIGLPTLRVFFSTRPIQSLNRDATPQVLLHEVLQSPNLNVDDMAVDVIRAQPSKRPVASIVSCRRKYLSGLLSSFEECEIRPYRAEPAPCALLRVAALRHRAPRKAKAVIRVFLNATQALAVLVAGELPLIWRTCDLPADPAAVAEAVVSTVLSINILGRYCGIDELPSLVMIHGRPDLAGTSGLESIQEKVDARVVHHAGPGLEAGEIAFGLALGCQPTVQAFDLAKTLKPLPSVWEVFPWGELAVQSAVLICATLFLNHRATAVATEYRAVHSEATKHAWLAKANDASLDKEKLELSRKVHAIKSFVGSRILWTQYTQDLSKQIPENILLKSLQGISEMEPIGKKSFAVKRKRSLILKLEAPVPRGQAIPQEIDRLLDSLRADPLLRRDFPLIELADLKWSDQPRNATALANFTVICLPKPDKAPPTSAPKADLKKGTAEK